MSLTKSLTAALSQREREYGYAIVGAHASCVRFAGILPACQKPDRQGGLAC